MLPAERREIRASFEHARAAVAGALALRDEFADSTQIRAAIHATDSQADAVEEALRRVSRILLLAERGQILLSETATFLAQADLPPNVALRDLGPQLLGGEEGVERTTQLIGRDSSTASEGLPEPRTRFFGREEALGAVDRLLTKSRLLTIVGEGGTGKTRLAIHVAQQVEPRYPHGVRLVEFAGLRHGIEAVAEVASSLGARELPGLSIETSLVEFLRGSRTLLIFDNCEGVLEEAGRLAQTLVRECPLLTILATSREPFGTPDETIYRLNAFPTPDLDEGSSFKGIERYDSVRLFVDRATAVRPSFALTASNSAAVAQVCRSVRGAPLALEIAAARASSMEVDRIAETLLERSFHGEPQTLESLIDWSYDLLAPQERAALRATSVFVGGWEAGAAAFVARVAEPGTTESEIRSILRTLVEKSLVRFDDRTGRYRLLETVRQYAWNRAERAGEIDRLRVAHTHWYTDWVQRPARQLLGLQQVEAANRIEEDHDNLRATHAFLMEVRDAEKVQRLVADLALFRETRGFLHEGANRGIEALDLGSSPARLGALVGTARILFLGSDPRAQGFYENALELARCEDDIRAEADAEQGLGNVLFWKRDIRNAESHFQEAYALRKEGDDAAGIASCLHSLGNVRLRDDRLAEAEALFEEALAIRREIGDTRGLTMTLGALSQLALARERYDEVVKRVRETVLCLSPLRLRWALALNLSSLIAVERHRGNFRRAALLAGARARVREVTGFPVPEVERAGLAAALEELRNECGAEAYDLAYAQGYATDWDGALALALESE